MYAKAKFTAIAIVLTVLPATCRAAEEGTTARTTVVETACEYATNPLGIDTAQPRLSWVLGSNRRGVMQKAYQVLVASSPERLAADAGDLWDSGRVQSDESVNVEYQGKKLSSRQTCFWKVRVWDDQGQAEPVEQAGHVRDGTVRILRLAWPLDRAGRSQPAVRLAAFEEGIYRGRAR